MSEEIKTIHFSRVQYFPIMMFAIIMGLGGLTLVYKKAHELLNFPILIFNIMAIFTVLMFLLILFFYTKKLFSFKEEVKKEVNHPVRINFFATTSISTLLLSMIFHNIQNDISTVLFYIGAIMHIVFTFYTIKFWINNQLEMQHSNPAWFIPIVGNLIVPIAGIGLVNKDILNFYFSIGIFFWIILFAIILNRIIFHPQFMQKFMPTMFILIAPPSIGFLSYLKLTESFDFFAQILFNLALFFTILVFVMYKNFVNIKFFISWWAFTFPMSAVSLAVLTMYNLNQTIFYQYLSYLFIAITTIIVFIVAKNTIEHILKKEICIME